MRIVRFESGGAIRWGMADGDGIVPLDGAPWDAGGEMLTAGDALDRSSVTLLSPVAPGKIFGIGRNYREHATELGNEVPQEPLVFLKATSAVVPHHGTIVLPKGSTRVDFEGELAVVIGKRARRVSLEEAARAVFGLTPAIDVTARDWQKGDGQWWRAKGSDTFCPLGPAIETGVDAGDLLLETWVDGERRQSGRTRDMVFDIPTLVSFVSQAVTLEPGDVILTGTPAGVGPLAPGQTVEVRIESVGTLTVTVAAEA